MVSSSQQNSVAEQLPAKNQNHHNLLRQSSTHNTIKEENAINKPYSMSAVVHHHFQPHLKPAGQRYIFAGLSLHAEMQHVPAHPRRSN